MTLAEDTEGQTSKLWWFRTRCRKHKMDQTGWITC